MTEFAGYIAKLERRVQELEDIAGVPPEKPFEVIATHLNGVEWWQVEDLPPRWHKCFVQSDYIREFDSVQRCACGAISRNNENRWVFKNESRASRKRNGKPSA